MANLLYPATTGHYTDDKYSPLLEPNLWYNNPFIPNVSFTAKYQLGAAGQIFVHKPGVAAITATVPGADFSDAIVQDSLITIPLNKQFNRSRKIYGATLAAVAYPAAASEMETAIKEIQKAWVKEAYLALATDSSVQVASNVTTVLATDASDVYSTIVSSRQQLVEDGVMPDTLIVSPKVYALLLNSDEFQRTGAIGDRVVSDAFVGRVAGLNVFEYQGVDSDIADSTTISGGTGSDITWATGDEMEYVMYQHDAFSIVTSVEAIRLVEEPTRFVGTLAQVQIVSGFKVTNPTCVLLKYHDASAT